MKLKTMLLALMLPFFAAAGEVAVTSVTAQQRYPWNGLVDITVTLQGSAEDVERFGCAFAAMNCATMKTISIEHIMRNGADVGSGNGWMRKYVWDAKADVGAVKIEDVAFTVDVEYVGVQLWENGPYWAECNVGATKPEEYGYYFWWGGTVGYKAKAFSFSVQNCPTYGKDNSQLQSEGYIDSAGNLVAAHDAATAHLGAQWRMPTVAELSALIHNCTTTWTTRNGVNGMLVTGEGAYASKSIFLPAASYCSGSELRFPGSSGSYWSSMPESSTYSAEAWDLCFNEGGSLSIYNNFRYGGRPVRPVRRFAK